MSAGIWSAVKQIPLKNDREINAAMNSKLIAFANPVNGALEMFKRAYYKKVGTDGYETRTDEEAWKRAGRFDNTNSWNHNEFKWFGLMPGAV